MQFKIQPSILTLVKELPNCPAGTSFIKTIDGNFYYNEGSNEIKQYFFSINELSTIITPDIITTFFSHNFSAEFLTFGNTLDAADIHTKWFNTFCSL